jgi:hypothetical protein
MATVRFGVTFPPSPVALPADDEGRTAPHFPCAGLAYGTWTHPAATPVLVSTAGLTSWAEVRSALRAAADRAPPSASAIAAEAQAWAEAACAELAALDPPDDGVARPVRSRPLRGASRVALPEATPLPKPRPTLAYVVATYGGARHSDAARDSVAPAAYLSTHLAHLATLPFDATATTVLIVKPPLMEVC